MRIDFCLTTLLGLPPQSRAPAIGDGFYIALQQAGFGGIQTETASAARDAGMVATAQVLSCDPAALDSIAERHAAEGFDATILVAGNGLEGDEAVKRYCDAVLQASARHRHRILLETHRGSITQDIRRTVDAIEHFPELRFCADFTHWYMGHELSLAGFDEKLAFMQPLIVRTDIVEGRIGSTNCAQVTLESASDDRHFVEDHRRFWTACFRASLERGQQVVFAPQLLPAVLPHNGIDYPIAYAQLQRGSSGHWEELSNRWEQTLLHCDIARECYAQARQSMSLESFA
jgi:hypothetical protein|tara:strand:- start:100987 stop:101850 length:864 start_codon:yes stop_codon:yes gene_type:complete